MKKRFVVLELFYDTKIYYFKHSYTCVNHVFKHTFSASAAKIGFKLKVFKHYRAILLNISYLKHIISYKLQLPNFC